MPSIMDSEMVTFSKRLMHRNVYCIYVHHGIDIVDNKDNIGLASWVQSRGDTTRFTCDIFAESAG